MKTRYAKVNEGHRPKLPRRPPPARARMGVDVLAPEQVDAVRPRIHGDSYSDVNREGDDIGTESTHTTRSDRRTEEPSERVLDQPERLEGEDV
jgi:hypothetical protein